MEFNEKLRLLRKQKNWTQEDLAGKLFVSRTAVSKWESGRGYPGIDYLKSIAGLFSVSVDDLLSGQELMTLAAAEQKQKTQSLRDVAFGVLDCMTALLFFLPLFALPENDGIKTVPLWSFTGNPDALWFIYVCGVVLAALFGIAQLALQNWQNKTWLNSKIGFSIVLGFFLTLLTILSRQPYPGALLLFILVFKGIMLFKQR